VGAEAGEELTVLEGRPTTAADWEGGGGGGETHAAGRGGKRRGERVGW